MIGWVALGRVKILQLSAREKRGSMVLREARNCSLSGLILRLSLTTKHAARLVSSMQAGLRILLI